MFAKISLNSFKMPYIFAKVIKTSSFIPQLQINIARLFGISVVFSAFLLFPTSNTHVLSHSIQTECLFPSIHVMKPKSNASCSRQSLCRG